VRLPQNVGLGRALNAGLQACAHEWVCRMDTDDICHSERFARQLAFVAVHPQIDVCGSQIDEFEHTPADAAHSRRVPCEHEEIARFAKSRNPINHMTVCYRKLAVLAAGNYQHAPLYEDYDLWVRMLLNGCRFANLPEVLVYARAGDDMYRRRGGWAYAKNELAMQRRFYRTGFLSMAQWAKNVLLRLPVRLLPERGGGAGGGGGGGAPLPHPPPTMLFLSPAPAPGRPFLRCAPGMPIMRLWLLKTRWMGL